jgi:DNA modification methylase
MNNNYFTWLKSKNEGSDLPKNLDKYAIAMPKEVSKKLIEMFSKKSESIIDPFCGFGEILFEAKILQRKVLGIEVDLERCKYCRDKKIDAICADTTKISNSNLPKFNACITSIPFYLKPTNSKKIRGDLSHEKNYDKYLSDIEKVFSNIKLNLSKEAKLVVVVKNLMVGKRFIPLAWDIANILRKEYTPLKEIIWVKSKKYYSRYKFRGGINHSYILIFKNEQ